MCPREMWFSVVGRAEPAVSLLGVPVAGGRCPPRELLQPVGDAGSGSSRSHRGVLAALRLCAAASQGSGNERLLVLHTGKGQLRHGGCCWKQWLQPPRSR